jgi:hypothetical protein
VTAIVDGHTRAEIAHELGYKGEDVPLEVCDD